jgi:hypothetical protein
VFDSQNAAPNTMSEHTDRDLALRVRLHARYQRLLIHLARIVAPNQEPEQSWHNLRAHPPR